MTTSPAARTATFLLTDIEGSTRLWEEQRAAMSVALEAHDALLRAAVEQAGGTVVKTTGDGVLAAFDRPEAGLMAAVEAQRALERHAWPTTGPLRVRMAIHSGSAEVRDGDFFGPALNRTARLMAIGHGGQVLVSSTTSALVAGDQAPGSALVDLGEHRLRDLDRPEHVYQVVATGLRSEFPPLRAVTEHPTNLRPQVTSFVGRERELAEVRRLLERSRLVTLVGVGGTGKTRLELQVAADALEGYGDGAWLVELAPLSDPELVVGEVGRVLRVQQEPGQPPIDTIADYLRSKELLLVLDNCEHLIAAAAEVTERLLGSCSALSVLTTSREPLGIDGEALFAVPSLALPAAVEERSGQLIVDDEALDRAGRSEAVSLFLERARATLPAFALDRSNVGAVVEICRRLDGIPLALELAAARVNVLSADEIAQGLSDRFRLLTGGRRTAVPRQRTLQALIDWSWDLLEDDDRRLLRRLAVFAGGWTLECATGVTFDYPADHGSDGVGRNDGGARLATLDGLGRLVDRSLVVVDHTGATRYRMLETIRQYAADQLAASGETVLLCDRQLAVFLRLARDAEQGLEGPELPAWMERLDAEIDNLRTALDWADGADPDEALEMCVALTRYWQSRAMGSEGLDRLLHAVERVRALPEPASAPVARARAVLVARGLTGASVVAESIGHAERASLGQEALALARQSGDPAAIADAIAILVITRALAAGERDVEGLRAMLDEAMDIANELGDGARAGRIAGGRALVEASVDLDAAERWLVRASEAAVRSGNPQEIAWVTQIRGRVASQIGRLDDAQRWFRQSQAQFHAIGDQRFELSVQSELGHVLRRSDRIDEAEAEYRQTLRGWQRSGNRGAVANQLESFAYVAMSRGDGVRAARLLGAAEALRAVAEAAMSGFEREEYDAALGRLRNELDRGSLGSAWAEGGGMTADAAVAFALSP
jgi:predicted ATPase/class 3 adenylate cyclase